MPTSWDLRADLVGFSRRPPCFCDDPADLPGVIYAPTSRGARADLVGCRRCWFAASAPLESRDLTKVVALVCIVTQPSPLPAVILWVVNPTTYVL